MKDKNGKSIRKGNEVLFDGNNIGVIESVCIETCDIKYSYEKNKYTMIGNPSRLLIIQEDDYPEYRI